MVSCGVPYRAPTLRPPTVPADDSPWYVTAFAIVMLAIIVGTCLSPFWIARALWAGDACPYVHGCPSNR